jgi:hypothetical protein
MLGFRSMTVIFLNDSVEKFVEFFIRIVRTSISTDSRIKIGNSREAASLESDTSSAALVFVLSPDLLCKISRES